MKNINKMSRLKRLPSAFYKDYAFVHWSMTIENRAVGWLNDQVHFKIREAQLHALGKYRLVCPAYCLMSDHGHFLGVGINRKSDQKKGVTHFRRNWNRIISPDFKLQKQPYDHVLRETERKRGAFGTIAQYIFENPVRAGMVEKWEDYPFSGAVVPGYYAINPRNHNFWNNFRKLYNNLAEDPKRSRVPLRRPETLPRSATKTAKSP